jgi:hypothetical protein
MSAPAATIERVMKPESAAGVARSLTGFLSLLGSSVVSALGFVVIASNRWSSFSLSCGVFIILFAQWQALGLTIAKTGIEQVVFAMVTEDDKSYLDPAGYVCRRVAWLSALFSLVVWRIFSPLAAAVAFATILLDAYSLIVMADLNARKRFRDSALANLLNYPLFFVALFVVHRLVGVDVATALLLFLLSSLVRWLYLRSRRVTGPDLVEQGCRANLEMGLQQALNYLLFRADQIMVAVLGLQAQVQEHLGMYLFLAKFPELAAGVLGIAGTVVFPMLYLKQPLDYRLLRPRAGRLALGGAAFCGGVGLSLLFYLGFWKGEGIPPQLALPFLVHALCIMLVNHITYSSLRQGYLQRLLMQLLISLAGGAFVVMWLGFNFSLLTLSWLVPIQLLAFVLLSLLLPRGTRRELYG